MNHHHSRAPKIHWAIWILATIPGLLSVSFFVQAMHARLILGRNPVTCIDQIRSPAFEMHHDLGELLFLGTLFGVLPLFLCVVVVRRLKRMPIRKPVFLFGSGVVLCVLLVLVNPWNYVDWWLD